MHEHIKTLLQRQRLTIYDFDPRNEHIHTFLTLGHILGNYQYFPNHDINDLFQELDELKERGYFKIAEKAPEELPLPKALILTNQERTYEKPHILIPTNFQAVTEAHPLVGLTAAVRVASTLRDIRWGRYDKEMRMGLHANSKSRKDAAEASLLLTLTEQAQEYGTVLPLTERQRNIVATYPEGFASLHPYLRYPSAHNQIFSH